MTVKFGRSERTKNLYNKKNIRETGTSDRVKVMIGKKILSGDVLLIRVGGLGSSSLDILCYTNFLTTEVKK